jgi:hypothetical protein
VKEDISSKNINKYGMENCDLFSSFVPWRENVKSEKKGGVAGKGLFKS